MCIEDFWRNTTETGPADRALYKWECELKSSVQGMCIEDNWRNRTETTPVDSKLYIANVHLRPLEE